MAAVVAPVLGGIWTAISEFTDNEPFSDPGFQRQLILAFIGLIALTSVADIIGRSVATSVTASRAQAPHSPVATVLPNPIDAKKLVKPPDPDIDGQVVAFRSLNDRGEAADSEYLFVADDGAVSWESGKDLKLIASTK
jgi:hypothetical protein